MSDDGFWPIPPVIGIVGVGLMGGSLGLALRRLENPPQIVGIGRSVERLRVALELGAIDTFVTDLGEGAAMCDAVVLCTTIDNILAILPEVLERAPATTTITDIGSTKSAIVAAAGGDPRFAGGHPMAGSEKSGVEAAAPTLYQGATWAITPSATTDEGSVRAVTRIARAAGARPLLFTPDAHDAMVAITSHVPHVLASALIRTAAEARHELPELYRMSAGSFADMTRVAASPPEIWRDVCLTNREAVLLALTRYRRQLDILESAVADSDAEAIERFFGGGAEEKRTWQGERFPKKAP